MTTFKKCQTCSRKIRSWNPRDIQRHLEICPTYFSNIKKDKRQIKCSICDHSFLDFRSAYHHLSITHFKEQFPRKFTKCSTCQKELKARNHTQICKKYFDWVKEYSNRWTCKICKKSTFSQKEIYLHVHKSHQGELSSTLNVSEEIANMETHQITTLTTNNTLEKGEDSTDTDEEVTEVFKCTSCGKHFLSFKATQKHILKTHMKDLIHKITL